MAAARQLLAADLPDLVDYRRSSKTTGRHLLDTPRLYARQTNPAESFPSPTALSHQEMDLSCPTPGSPSPFCSRASTPQPATGSQSSAPTANCACPCASKFNCNSRSFRCHNSIFCSLRRHSKALPQPGFRLSARLRQVGGFGIPEWPGRKPPSTMLGAGASLVPARQSMGRP